MQIGLLFDRRRNVSHEGHAGHPGPPKSVRPIAPKGPSDIVWEFEETYPCRSTGLVVNGPASDGGLIWNSIVAN
jgi:hypothetical protein